MCVVTRIPCAKGRNLQRPEAARITRLLCAQMGVAENRLRKWLLSITAVLRSQNGALASALALWQRNCAREFAGVEECLICYNVISAAGGQLPRLECKTCHKKYHGGCLFKWFRSAAKSACPPLPVTLVTTGRQGLGF